MKTQVRLATVSDAEKIWVIQQSSFQSQAKLYPKKHISALHEHILDIRTQIKSSDITTFVMLSNETIIGAVRGSIKKDTIEISKLVIDINHQDQGLGKQLIKHLEDHFYNLGFKTFRLRTGYKSAKNLHLYKSLGYKKISEELIDEPLTVIHLEKTISN